MLTDEAVVWDSLHFGFSWTDNVLCMKWLDSGFGYVSQSAVLTCLAIVDVGHDRLLLRAWSLSHAPPAVPVVKQVEHNISNLTKKNHAIDWLSQANAQPIDSTCLYHVTGSVPLVVEPSLLQARRSGTLYRTVSETLCYINVRLALKFTTCTTTTTITTTTITTITTITDYSDA